MDPKKTALFVVLIVVIVGAVVVVAKKAGVVGGGPEAPSAQLSAPTELIDKVTLEVITQPFSEWEKGPKYEGAYKNPHTGQYTMVPVMICKACGAKIPRPMTRDERMAMSKGEYKCPKCGKNPVTGE